MSLANSRALFAKLPAKASKLVPISRPISKLFGAGKTPKLISASICGSTPDAPKVIVHNARYHKSTPPTSPVLGSLEEPAPGIYQTLQSAHGFSIVVPTSASKASFEESIQQVADERVDSIPSSSTPKHGIAVRPKTPLSASKPIQKPGFKVGSKKLNRVKTLMAKRMAAHDPERTDPLMLAMHNNLARAIAARPQPEPPKAANTMSSKDKRTSLKRPVPAPLDTDAARAYSSETPECDSPPESPGPVTPVDETHPEQTNTVNNTKKAAKTPSSNKSRRRGGTHVAGSRARQAVRPTQGVREAKR